MFQFITSAPVFWVRELIAFARGVNVEAVPDDSPAWGESIVRGSYESDVTSIIAALSRGGFRIEGWKPKPAIADPTFAMAAARIDRERGGSAPASSWVK